MAKGFSSSASGLRPALVPSASHRVQMALRESPLSRLSDTQFEWIRTGLRYHARLLIAVHVNGAFGCPTFSAFAVREYHQLDWDVTRTRGRRRGKVINLTAGAGL